MSLRSITLMAAASAGLLASPLVAQDAIRQVPGYFADVKDPDLLVLRDDGNMTFHYHVAAFLIEYDFKHPAGTTVMRDVVRLPGAGGIDSFVWTGNGGLYKSSYVAGNPSTLFNHIPIETYAGSSWRDADRVMIPEGGPANTYVGIDFSAAKLIVHSGGFSSTTTTFTSPLDATLADWDGDGDDDVITVHSWGVLVQTQSGTVIDTTSFPTTTWTDARCARIRDTGNVRDLVAVTARDASSSATFVGVFGDLMTDHLSALPNYEGLEFAAADFDADGLDDLAVTVDGHSSGPLTAPTVLVLYHDIGGATGRYHEGDSAVWSAAGSITPDTAFSAAPAIHDFLRDGELDACVWGNENSATVPVVIENPATDVADHRIPFDVDYATVYDSPLAYDLTITPSTPTLSLAGATHMHVEWWTISIDDVTLEASVEPAGHGVQSYPHPGFTSASLHLEVPEACFDGYAFIRVYEAVESGGLTTARGPANWMIVSVDAISTVELNDDLEYDEFPINVDGGPIGGAGNGSNSDDPPRPPGSGNGSGGDGGANSGG